MSTDASPLPTRKLGRANVSVSTLGLGTAPLGDLWDVVEEAEAGALLNDAWDGGVRYFDTSPWYGKGQAEHRVGRAFYRKPRDEFVISSKIGFWPALVLAPLVVVVLAAFVERFGLRHVHHPGGEHLEALPFQMGDDFSCLAAPERVGLDDRECVIASHVPFLSVL